MTAPAVQEYNGITVVRDDLFPGGSKARFFLQLFELHEEIVYASPAEGGAQTALAHAAAQTGKRATIFVAKRNVPHARAMLAKRLGAKVYQVPFGRLNVVQARARSYCEDHAAHYLQFGGRGAQANATLAAAALATGIEPDEVWCAAGSGVLATALHSAWPKARLNAVRIGRELHPEDAPGAKLWRYPAAFSDECLTRPPFPADPHYDAKAWEFCRLHQGPGTVLFWNVAGPA